MSLCAISASALLFICTIIILRIIHVLPATKFHDSNENGDGNGNGDMTKRSSPSATALLKDPTNKKLMILLGSGGHTGEMIRILSQFDNSILNEFKKDYVISSGDKTSILKIQEFQDIITKNNDTASNNSEYTIVPRARNVGESLFLSILHTLQSIIATFKILLNKKLQNKLPDILLLNGPGTSVPLGYILFLFKIFGLSNSKIVYIESLARVKKLSLSGKLLKPISDRFIVQWEYLNVGRAEYYGILV
ncbi:hypothetical protein PACTADRAFT_74561 [Pachysolen tannophilus NRRL Y-2460]|uniref:UDP-N-acetylglucosamine transferase subunit ALG14 n=1 Tax=Pachysolen tannophilus NRRL Y-2460 TaxID=669874 RepID=A0A1E4TYZ7_PACTA|nr:hypothetical protein PACTADRAFT_74561 [Pachysolen tannophilus NRRL Y-2460]